MCFSPLLDRILRRLSGCNLQLNIRKNSARQNILYICYTAQINTQSEQNRFPSGQIATNCLPRVKSFIFFFFFNDMRVLPSVAGGIFHVL